MEIINLFRFIDWLLWLPNELAAQFWREIQQYEETRQMPYITSVERIGLQQGLQQGREEGLRQGLLVGIELALELKFGAEGLQLMPEIRQVSDLSVIQAIHERLKTAATLDDVRRSYTGQGAG